MSKMNKKLPALFLTLVLVLGMTACGGKTTDGTTGSTDNTVTAEEEDHKTQNTKVTLIPQSPKKCFATMQSLRQKTSPMM